MIKPYHIPSYIRRVYIHFGIPMEDWPKHYEIDFPRGHKNTRARRNYQAISRCISRPAGNAERAHSRYYERKQMMVGLSC